MYDGEAIMILFVVALVIGGACSAVANSKGRNGVGWFFLGFIMGFLVPCLGIFCIVLVAVLPNLNEENARWSMQNEESRRLREQLRQEQMKNEALRQHTAARLDLHDRELGIDTKNAGPNLPAAGPTQQPTNLPYLAPGETSPAPTDASVDWYYVDNKQQQGPVDMDMIRLKIQEGVIKRDTLVWNENMTKWEAAGLLRPLQESFPA